MKESDTEGLSITDNSYSLVLGGYMEFNYSEPINSSRSERCVYALVERDGNVLVENKENSKFPGGEVCTGETPRDALYRILRMNYKIEPNVMEKIKVEGTKYFKYVPGGDCYRTVISGGFDTNKLMWSPLEK